MAAIRSQRFAPCAEMPTSTSASPLLFPGAEEVVSVRFPRATGISRVSSPTLGWERGVASAQADGCGLAAHRKRDRLGRMDQFVMNMMLDDAVRLLDKSDRDFVHCPAPSDGEFWLKREKARAAGLTVCLHAEARHLDVRLDPDVNGVSERTAGGYVPSLRLYRKPKAE